jgi:hypothetical protein
MMTLKDQMAAELEPLLHQAEKAISGHDTAEAHRVSLEMLRLVGQYATRLAPAEIREVLNSPTATAIAKRLGVQP